MEGDGLMLCLEIVIGEGRESKRSNLEKVKVKSFEPQIVAWMCLTIPFVIVIIVIVLILR